MCLAAGAADSEDMLGFILGLGGSDKGRLMLGGGGGGCGADASSCLNRMTAWSCANRARNLASSRMSLKNSSRS